MKKEILKQAKKEILLKATKRFYPKGIPVSRIYNLASLCIDLALAHREKEGNEHCPYCGEISWTKKQHGIILHKKDCPYNP